MAVLAQDLRDAVLQAALQGKLTEQLDTDSSVDELLSEIKEKKEQLIRDKKIKNHKLMQSEDEEKPFEIPTNWRWVNLSEIIDFKIGKTPKRDNDKYWNKNDFPWVSIADMIDGQKISTTKEYVTKSAAKEIFNAISPKGTLLMSFKLTVGRVSILDCDAYHNEAIISIYPFIDKNNIIKMYLFKILPFISNFGETKNAIKGKTLNTTSISKLLIPLPPIEEQSRIVARIEELMKKIDEYEKIENRLEEIKKAFPNDMKDAILQAAMQGKLTEQLPTDSSVDDLIEQIKKERKKLEDEGKIKKSKSTKSVEFWEDENLPSNWKMTNLSSLVDIKNGFTPKRTEEKFWKNGTIPWFTVEDIHKQGRIIKETNQHITKDALGKSTTRILPPNTVLLCCTASIGEYAFSEIELTTNQQWNGLVIKKECEHILNNQFLYKWVMTLKQLLITKSNSTTFAFLSVDKLNNFEIPIPPIEEQQRIVEQLDKLLPLCDDLK